jgi:phage repressor protein C with HTH and peptisase S24 domain|nr:MAG TPA: hypothetical protein [Caudoviricetes sp.]
MKTKEALSEIIGFKKRNVSQQEIGKVLGVTKQYIGQSMNKELTEEQLKLLEQHFRIDFTKVNKKEDKITVDYYPDVIASCGPGGFELSQECIQYDVPATLFPPSKNVKGYSMCHAKGNSMFPRIWDGDFVICEHKDNMKIENGEMYIFCYDDQIYLKRLTKNINQIVVESENPDFPTQYIEKEQMNDVHLIGHVICSGRMNGKYLDKRV